jgi:membrane fusion protein, heavy metal efflux system
VFVKTGEAQYTRKTIVPVARNDRWVSIAQGLDKGDEVVTDGALYLQKLLDENLKLALGTRPQIAPANASGK